MDLNVETLPWHHRRHHCAGGFENLLPSERAVSLWKGITWSARRIFHGKEHTPPPVRLPDLETLRSRPEHLRVTWLGHSTALVQTPTLTLLTDPIFSRRASPVTFAGPSRLAPAPLRVRDLPPVDVVLLSHDHYDHCDQATIEALARQHAPTFFVPLGVAARLRTWDVGPAVELDWWQRATLGTEAGPLRLTCTPARHFSGRSLFDHDSTLWASWMIDAPAEASADESQRLRVYFGGDTGEGDHFEKIAERLPTPEVALLPIGAFLPRALMASVHIGPVEALEAFNVLGARHFVPLHWGTFDLAEETVQAPAELLAEAATRHRQSDGIHVPDPGEVLTFDRPASVAALDPAEAAAPAP